MGTSTFRRCHHCNTTLEAEHDQITRCDGCGKHLAPFYFFKDADVPIYCDTDVRPFAAKAVMWGFATTWGVDEREASRG